MRRRIFWDPAQQAVVQQVLSLALHGVEVIYVPGNHDELVRDFVGSEIRGVRIQRELVHWTADGRRFRVSHGDEFDGVVRHNRVAHWLGDFGYNLLLNGSRHLNTIRRHLGHRYWSLSLAEDPRQRRCPGIHPPFRGSRGGHSAQGRL
jgi:UDP-2,3-diacylglucosamine pyrophosphatase LpxH